MCATCSNFIYFSPHSPFALILNSFTAVVRNSRWFWEMVLFGGIEFLPSSMQVGYAVAKEFGGLRRTLAAVNPGTRIKLLSIADTNVDTAGEP